MRTCAFPLCLSLALVTACTRSEPKQLDPAQIAAIARQTMSTTEEQAPLAPPAPYIFAPAVRLTAAGAPISVEEPGYACPTMADVDGDGRQDLVVGQFTAGAMQFFRNLSDGDQPPRFAAAAWIHSGDQRAVVPGVS